MSLHLHTFAPSEHMVHTLMALHALNENQKDSEGFTALQNAQITENAEIISLLEAQTQR